MQNSPTTTTTKRLRPTTRLTTQQVLEALGISYRTLTRLRGNDQPLWHLQPCQTINNVNYYTGTDVLAAKKVLTALRQSRRKTITTKKESN